MEKFVARANIDHFLELLQNREVSARNRTMINRLLLEEENKLGSDREQLEFAESRAALCRARADRQRQLMDSFDHNSTQWMLAERLLVNFESLAQLAENFCQQMRERMNA